MTKTEFINQIRCENDFIREAKKAEKEYGSVYIFGDGWGKNIISRILQENNIHLGGILVNRKYMNGKTDVICFEDYVEAMDPSKGKCPIVIAITYYDVSCLEEYKDKINLLYYDLFFPFEDVILDYEWVKANTDRLYSVYTRLEDDLSRETFIAFINQRITSNWKYLKAVRSQDPQYFENGLIKFTDNELFVDCGAFDGDSAEDFLKALDKQGIKQYKGIVSFEPDDINFEKLEGRHFANHRCIKKGVTDVAKSISFSGGNGTSSKFGEGDQVLELCTIDDELGNDKATYIKMDIEGMEPDALVGARKTIQAHHPKLAICVYHKKEHLFEIQELIREMDNSYKFYLRAYENRTTELVMYAL